MFQIILLRQLNLGIMSVYSYFTFLSKGKSHFPLIHSFYCCLVKEGWALKLAEQFAIPGLVAYKPVAYKKNQV